MLVIIIQHILIHIQHTINVHVHALIPMYNYTLWKVCPFTALLTTLMYADGYVMR